MAYKYLLYTFWLVTFSTGSRKGSFWYRSAHLILLKCYYFYLLVFILFIYLFWGGELVQVPGMPVGVRGHLVGQLLSITSPGT